MGGHLKLWPPPWELNSSLRRVASYLWLCAMAPVFLLSLALVIPVAIVSKLTGWGATAKRSRESVCRTIEEFVNGGGGPWDWDDFISVPDADPLLEQARRRCVSVAEQFRPDGPGQWCGPKGLDELRRIAQELRGNDG